ncbi:MAG: efflux RND transporter periplasmic adaptor subunit [Chthoniobacteraceae bacterium]
MTAIPFKKFRLPTRVPPWLTPTLARVGRRPALWSAVAVGGLGVMLAISSHTGKRKKWNASETPPVTASAVAGPFMQEVVERGEVESSSNVEIRCQVQQSRAAGGTAIIQIVPEGAYVKEGEFLVKLDDSGLQADLVMQQIASNTSRASVVGAQADYDATKLALQEYESGTFRQEEGALESDEFVAKENLRRAEEYLRYSEKLAARGYVTEVQLEADRFAVEKARKELDAASTKLEVLHRYTKVKTLNKLKADVETTEARLKSLENSHKLDLERQTALEEQLAHCVIKAPTSGQVVYANLASGEPLIAEGKLVRERQVIIRLPDPKRMQVTARVNESRIDRVKKGMNVRIRLDAFPEQELAGTVRDISEYPLPAISSYSTMKEYGAEIDIHDPPPGVRTGMTAQAAIEIEKIERAVQVPLPAVLERGKRFFCLVTQGDQLTAQEVSVGPANEQSVIIQDGLNEGDQVLLAPQSYEKSVTLPETVPGERPQTPEARAVANAAAAAKSAAR